MSNGRQQVSLVLSALAATLNSSAISTALACSIFDIFVLEVFTRARILKFFDHFRRPIAVRICLRLLGHGLLLAVFDNS